MDRYFKIKFNDFICPDCGNKLYIPDIIRQLRRQYEVNTDAGGYLSLIIATCECGNRYKIYCNCHDWNGEVAVCADKIKKLYSDKGENKESR